MLFNKLLEKLISYNVISVGCADKAKRQYSKFSSTIVVEDKKMHFFISILQRTALIVSISHLWQVLLLKICLRLIPPPPPPHSTAQQFPVGEGIGQFYVAWVDENKLWQIIICSGEGGVARNYIL